MLLDISPLRVSRDYRLLFFGQLVSFFGSMMTFVHDHIASRREASWLMRFWSTAHQRLAEFVSNRPVLPMRRRDIAFGLVDGASAVARGVSSCHA